MIDLNCLNAEQREAVLDTEHNLLLLACAGSGKTRTITTKIAYYLEMGILKPWEILAVTFTNKAAFEMRERINQMLPDMDLRSLEVRTFHSFGAWMLRRHSQEAMLADNFGIYDDSDSVSLLGTLFPTTDKKLRREFGKSIAKAKDFGVSPDDNKLYEINGDDMFRMCYKRYESALRANGNCDFADLILRPVELLMEHPEIRERYQNRFKLVLVDEYQDSNKMQFELLKLITGDNTQICVVGDDDQSIYAFRGAVLDNILTFAKSFKNVREIKIEKNYRSTEEILKLAGGLIKQNRKRHDKEIVSAVDAHGPKPKVIECQDGDYEAFNIASTIKRDRLYKSTAIIYRTNAQSLPFEIEFKKQNIPFKLVGALRFYDREEVKDALSLLFLIINRRDTVNFKRIIHKPTRGIGQQAQEQIFSYGPDLITGLEIYAGGSSKSAESARGFLNIYNDMVNQINAGNPLGEVLLYGIVHTGLMAYYEKESDKNIVKARKENIEALISSFGSYGPGMVNLISYLENITLDNSTIGGTGKENVEDEVVLITMHNTKGLEFDNVFVAGLEDEIIPGGTSMRPTDVEEERRILYVALTRARKRLVISNARKRLRWGHYEYMHPSRFIQNFPAGTYESNVSHPERTTKDYSGMVGARMTYGKRISSWNGPTLNDIEGKKEEKKIKRIELHVGDVISSDMYGKGTVKALEGDMATIEFLCGRKRLNRNINEFRLVESAKQKKAESTFNVGDKVTNPTYGLGEIVKREVKNEKANIVLLTIRFANSDVQFVEKFAKIEKVN